MDREGIGYEQRDNCFVSIDDVERAQKLLDRLTSRNWESYLRKLAHLVNPWIHPDEGLDLHGYYWSVRQGEFATDVMFHEKSSLERIYPALVKHAMHNFSSKDVMRFLGRRTNSRFNGEAKTHFQERDEGVRVKHWAEENSIKMYDKQGWVLRVETTINDPRRFKVRRLTNRKGVRCMGWLPLRRGIADMTRRVEISRAANERYYEALAVVGIPDPTHEFLNPVQRRVTKRNRAHWALRPLTKQESQLFKLLLTGEHSVQGFRNRDVRATLYPRDGKDPDRRRRVSGRVTRWFQLLRAHGLIRKVSKTTYYRVTNKGHKVMNAAIKLRDVSVLALAS